MYTDHFLDKKIDQTPLQNAGSNPWFKAKKQLCAHYVWKLCKCAHKNQGHNTAFPASGENPCEEQRGNSALFFQQLWLTVSFAAFAQCAGRANFCPGISVWATRGNTITQCTTSRWTVLYLLTGLKHLLGYGGLKNEENSLGIVYKKKPGQMGQKGHCPGAFRLHLALLTTARAKEGGLRKEPGCLTRDSHTSPAPSLTWISNSHALQVDTRFLRDSAIYWFPQWRRLCKEVN